MYKTPSVRYVLVGLTIVAAGQSTSTFAADVEKIRIGLAAPLSGPQSQYGKDFEDGAILAVEQINATHPEIGNKAVELVLDLQDDQADPKTGTEVAQRLVDDKVNGVIGHVNSGVSIPASAIYARANIPQISVSTSPAYTQQGFATTFRAATSDAQQGAAMAKYVVNVLKAKRIVIIDDRTAYGQGLADQFERGIKQMGGSILDRQYVTDRTIDFRAILTILKAERPDLVYYAGSDSQSGPLLKQARGLGIRSTFASGDMSKTEAFLKISGAASDGSLVSLSGLPIENMPDGIDFSNKFKKRFGLAPSTMSPYSFDSVMAMMQAMKNAKSVRPEIYLPYLANIDVPGVTSKHFAFDKSGDQRESDVTLYKVVNGQFVALHE